MFETSIFKKETIEFSKAPDPTSEDILRGGRDKFPLVKEALKDVKEAGCERVQIISDWPMTDLGYVGMVGDICHGLKMNVNVFSDVTPDPTLTCIKKVTAWAAPLP